MTILISGSGIAGLTLGLTCQQLGFPFKIFESAKKIKPMGVGINIQPNAVRELFDLGFEDDLEKIGVKTKEFGTFTKKGLKIWTEPRGKVAGYNWPQYSVHRGQLQMMLYNRLINLAGKNCICTGWKVRDFKEIKSGISVEVVSANKKEKKFEAGSVLIGADGIHSRVRKIIHPDEGGPIWNGAVLWRGTSESKPFRTGASMVMIGHASQRVVAYPITKTNKVSGKAIINWITELKFDSSKGWRKEDWSRKVNSSEFLPKFKDWKFDWIDIPELINNSEDIFEYPMVDRDPVKKWKKGKSLLIGDAAHPTYPVGSNGASQAIIDARKLGLNFINQGINEKALEKFEMENIKQANNLILANRKSGPDAILQLVEDICGGQFENISDIISEEKLSIHAENYKKTAGFSIKELNSSKSILEGY